MDGVSPSVLIRANLWPLAPELPILWHRFPDRRPGYPEASVVRRMRLRLWPLACVVAVTLAQPASGGEPLNTAQLLVDLARDYALNQRGKQTPADVQQVRVLLQAAVRLDPKLAEAHAWLCELALLDDDQAEAGRMLGALLAADPAQESAFGRWLVAGLRTQQTSEKRKEWLEAVAAVPRPPVQRAEVCVAQAHLALEGLDNAEARRQLMRALVFEPACLDAATLLLQTLERGAPAAERLRATLRVLQLSPLSELMAWQAASILDEYGFADDAGRFFEYASALHWKANPQESVSASFLLGWAKNLEARGRTDEALERARNAAAADPLVAAEAGIFMYHVLERKQRGLGAGVRADLVKRFAALRDPAAYPVNEVAQAAWFYAAIERQPDRALMLAQAASQRAPTDPFMRRALGWALVANERIPEARETFRPIADHDPYAAYMLARLLRDGGDAASAREVVAQLEPKPRTGPVAELLRQLEEGASASQPVAESQPAAESQPVAESQPAEISDSSSTSQAAAHPQPIAASSPAVAAPSQPTAASQPVSQRYPEVAVALAEFDPRVLEFFRQPDKFLAASVTLAERSFAPGDPWWAVFALTNRGPFPIVLGPDAAVNPVFLLSFSVEGDQKREYPALLTIAVDQLRVLHPGQTVSVRRTLDIGPLSRVARGSPQQAQRITLRVLLDGVAAEDGQWRVAAGGQPLPTVYFTRLPASAGVSAINALFSALASDPGAQFKALEIMAQLVGERQRADAGRLEYRPEPVPSDRMQAALLNLLDSDSWESRVRALNALQLVGLDRRAIGKAEANLAHSHWLVRLMAVRLLARQGAAFRERAETLSHDDADELVRSLAESYVKKWAEPENPKPDAGNIR